jgi:hypothetical protein
MNERIRELAIQAGLPTALDYHQKRYEKFAELIVRECADIATINAHQYQPPGDFVLKHFGVEE